MYKSIGEDEKNALLTNLKILRFKKQLRNKNTIKRIRELSNLIDFSKDTILRKIEVSDVDLNLIEGFFIAYDEALYNKYRLTSDIVENLSALYNQSIMGIDEFTKDSIDFKMEYNSLDDFWEYEDSYDAIDNLENLLKNKFNVCIDYTNTHEIQNAQRENDKTFLDYMSTIIDLKKIINYLDCYSDTDDDENWYTCISYTLIPIPKSKYVDMELIEHEVEKLITTKPNPCDGAYQEAYLANNKQYIVITYTCNCNFYRTKKFWQGLTKIKNIFDRSNVTKN